MVLSGSHAMGLIEVVGRQVSQEEVDEMNEEKNNRRDRYSTSPEGNLLIGKQYHNAEQRIFGGYKADTNVGVMNVELWHRMQEDDDESAPHLVLYEMPQTHAEPNKVDTFNPERPPVGLEIYKEVGMYKLVDYITCYGVGNITSQEVGLLKPSHQYSQSDSCEQEQDVEKKKHFSNVKKLLEILIKQVIHIKHSQHLLVY